MTRLPFVLVLSFAALGTLGAFATLAHAIAQQPIPPAPPPAQTPVNESAAAPVTPAVPDPAAVTFTTGLGLILVAVKPTAVADYESAIVALQDAFAKSEDEATRTLARSWRVYKGEVDAKANPLYVHVLYPAVPTVDYRPSLWLDKLLSGAPPDLLAKYRDAFAAPPTKLGLVEFASMAVAPVARPANTSPAAPVAPGTPGNASPATPRNGSPTKPRTGSPGAPVPQA